MGGAVVQLQGHSLPSLHSGALGVSTDPSDQLCLHGAGAQRRCPLRLLLAGGAARLLPGSGHAGCRHGDGLELRVHAGVGGQLRRERRGGLRAALQGDR